MPWHVIVNHVEELIDILTDANAPNTPGAFAERDQRLHRAIPQALLNKPLARAVRIVHLGRYRAGGPAASAHQRSA
jgi:DNA-binding FadR family transcriptional regulator